MVTTPPTGRPDGESLDTVAGLAGAATAGLGAAAATDAGAVPAAAAAGVESDLICCSSKRSNNVSIKGRRSELESLPLLPELESWLPVCRDAERISLKDLVRSLRSTGALDAKEFAGGWYRFGMGERILVIVSSIKRVVQICCKEKINYPRAAR